MTNNQTTCDPDRINFFLDQKLSDDEQAAFESHLTECDDCCRRLEATAASEDAWRHARDCLREIATDDPRTDDSAAGEDVSTSQATILKLLAPTDDDRMIGRWGTYEVVGVVGTGGMGVVLKAFESALNRYVAIKILAPHLGSSGAAIRRFSREGKAAAAVVHDNVIEIYGVADAAGLPYLVMPYVRGPSLQRRLDSAGPLATVEILRVAMQAAAGLAAAHAQGLVHRDVKPANILLADGIERVKLTDFGLARAADDASLTRTGVIAGTPQYMSPEQARGEPVDPRSDLFSLGSVLYAMCTGRPPFRAETSYGVLRRITDEEPRPIREINPDIPEWLCAIVSKLMAKRPEDRFQSAHEVAALLEQCLAHVQQPASVPLPAVSPLLPGEGQGVGAVAGARKPRPFAGWSGRKRIVAAVIALFFFGGLWPALGILIHLKKGGKTTTIEVPDGSTAHVDDQGAVTVELPTSAEVTRMPPALRTDEGQSRIPVGPWVAKLSTGTVELLGVAEWPLVNDSNWWKPDGSPAKIGPFLEPPDQRPSYSLSDRWWRRKETIPVAFAMRIKDLPADSSWPVWDFEPWGGYYNATGAADAGGNVLRDCQLLCTLLSSSASTAKLRVGIDSGPWETVITHPVREGTASYHRAGRDWNVTFENVETIETIGKDRETTVILKTAEPQGSWRMRLVAVANDGSEHPSWIGSMNGSGTASFNRLPLSSIKEFRLQARPYAWVEFRKVSLRAGQKTEVQVVETASILPAGVGAAQQRNLPALQFDGQPGSCVSVPNMDMNRLTFATWVKRDVTQQKQYMIMSSGTGGWGVYFSEIMPRSDHRGPNNDLLWFTYRGVNCWSSDVPVADTQWHFVAVTLEDHMLCFYVDGKPAGKAAMPDTLDSRGGDYWLGGVTPGDINPHDGLRGCLAETMVFDRALDADKIAALYRRGREPRRAMLDGLIAGYHFDKGHATTANDFSDHGRNGTLHGGAKWVRSAEPPPSTQPSAAEGPHADALHFDQQHYALVSRPVKFTENDFTISLWLKPDSKGPRDPTVAQYILNRSVEYQTQRGDMALKIGRLSHDLDFCLFGTDGGRSDWIFGWDVPETRMRSPVIFDQWNHVVVTRSGDKYTMWMNGKRAVSEQSGANVSDVDNTHRLTLGGPPPESGRTESGFYESFLGDLDDLRTFRRCLSDKEIEALYSSDGAEFALKGEGRVKLGPQQPTVQAFYSVTYAVDDIVLAAPQVVDVTAQSKQAAADSRWAGPAKPDFRWLVGLICANVAPETWALKGGKGTISHNEANLSLNVIQTREVHEKLTDFLEDLRRRHDMPVSLEARVILLDAGACARLGANADYVTFTPAKARGFCDGARRESEGGVGKLPTITLFPDQAARYRLPGSKTMSCEVRPVLSSDRETVSLNIKIAGKSDLQPLEVKVEDGHSVLVNLAHWASHAAAKKTTPEGSLLLIMLKPHIYVQVEEEDRMDAPVPKSNEDAHNPETGQKQETKWTPENIKKDPVGYLRWAIDQADTTKTTLEAAERALGEQKRALSDKLRKASADKSNYETLFAELKQAYEKAVEKNHWPVSVRNQKFDSSGELKRVLVECDRNLKNATKLLETYSTAKGKVADRLDEIDKQRARAETLRIQLETDLEAAKVQQTLDGIGAPSTK